MISFWKKTEEKQNSANIMISLDGKGSFASEVGIAREIVWKKILKMRILKKI